MHCYAFVCFIFIVSSPLFFLIDTETDAAPSFDYTLDNQPFASELPGKHSPIPLIFLISPISFSLMLALDFATVVDSSYSDA
jgi:hypothetical protein